MTSSILQTAVAASWPTASETAPWLFSRSVPHEVDINKNEELGCSGQNPGLASRCLMPCRVP